MKSIYMSVYTAFLLITSSSFFDSRASDREPMDPGSRVLRILTTHFDKHTHVHFNAIGATSFVELAEKTREPEDEITDLIKGPGSQLSSRELDFFRKIAENTRLEFAFFNPNILTSKSRTPRISITEYQDCFVSIAPFKRQKLRNGDYSMSLSDFRDFYLLGLRYKESTESWEYQIVWDKLFTS